MFKYLFLAMCFAVVGCSKPTRVLPSYCETQLPFGWANQDRVYDPTEECFGSSEWTSFREELRGDIVGYVDISTTVPGVGLIVGSGIPLRSGDYFDRDARRLMFVPEGMTEEIVIELRLIETCIPTGPHGLVPGWCENSFSIRVFGFPNVIDGWIYETPIEYGTGAFGEWYWDAEPLNFDGFYILFYHDDMGV